MSDGMTASSNAVHAPGEWMRRRFRGHVPLLAWILANGCFVAGYVQWLHMDADIASESAWLGIEPFASAHAMLGLPSMATAWLYPVALLSVVVAALAVFEFVGHGLNRLDGRASGLGIGVLACLWVLPVLLLMLALVLFFPGFEATLAGLGRDLPDRWMRVVDASRFMVGWWWAMLLAGVFVASLAGAVAGAFRMLR
jgi:hypothetical protein